MPGHNASGGAPRSCCDPGRDYRLFFSDLLFFRLGPFLPFLRRSERPMAMACSRFFTFRPLPDLSLPRLYARTSRSTSFDALLEYFRAMRFSQCALVRVAPNAWQTVCIGASSISYAQAHRIELKK